MFALAKQRKTHDNIQALLIQALGEHFAFARDKSTRTFFTLTLEGDAKAYRLTIGAQLVEPTIDLHLRELAGFLSTVGAEGFHLIESLQYTVVALSSDFCFSQTAVETHILLGSCAV